MRGDAPAAAAPAEAPPPLRLVAATELAPAGSAHPSAPPKNARYEEALLEVDVNRQGLERSLVVLRRSDGMFLVKLEDLAAFRLKLPSTAPYLHDGAPYFPIDALEGGRFSMDEVHQRLTIMAAPAAFENTLDVVPGPGAYPKAARPSTGAFLNYDLAVTGGGGSTFISDLLEGGVFTPYGVLVHSQLATRDQDGVHGIRLESTFTSDFPDRHTSLRVGDWITRPGAWGNTVRFGGIQYGTNFGTDPAFRTFPTQPLRGQAVVPSIVDVFVNNALVATRRIDPGPFTLSNVPFTTGGGTVRLVVRDINNQQQVYTVSDPFYSSNTLLKAGLSDYSAEAGKLRENFGVESFSYRDAFAAGTYRHGITDRLTAEVRGEAAEGQRAIGTSATALHPVLGQFDATFAASQSNAGNGHLVGLGYQRQVMPFSIGGQAQWASPEFRRLGEVGNQASLRMQGAFSAGLQLGTFGSVTFNYVSQFFRDRPRLTIDSLGYSVSLGHWGQLNVTALRSSGDTDSTLVAAGITVPLELNTNVSAQYDTTRSGPERDRQLSLSYQRNRSLDSPYSYRVSTRDRDVEGVFDYRGDRVEAELGLARSESGPTVGRVQLAGGIGYLGGYTFLSRRITSSFAVVQVADYPDVAVLFDNQFVGRTNEKGFFVIPELRAYDRNVIAVRDTDLPLDASVASLKIDASPYFRSGILVQFPVKHLRAGVLYLVLEDGTPMPSGSTARLDTGTEDFPVALRGELYVNGFGARNRLTATWKGRSCTIDLVYPDTRDPLPDLGRHVCKGVTP